jgi:hypothetical protein
MKLTDSDLVCSYIFVIIFYALSIFYTANNSIVWILDGAFIQTAIFVVISVVIFFNLKSNEALSIVISLFVLMLNIVPGLRYQIFYGVFDSPGHYNFSNQISILGHIPQNAFYSNTYGGNPGMHLSLASVSLASGLSVNWVFKFIAPALFGLFPLILYFIGNKILDGKTLKFSLIAASLPVLSSYEVWGTSLAFIAYFMLGALFLKLVLFRINARYLFSFLLVSFLLIISHAITSLFFLLLILGELVFLMFLARIKKVASTLFSYASIGVLAFFYGVILIIWWSTFDTVNLRFFIDVVAQIFQQEMPVVSVTFYNLSIISRIQTVIVLNSANAVILLFSILGVFIFIRYVDWKEKKLLMRSFFWFVIGWVGIITLFLAVQLVANFGLFSYQRLLIYAIPWCVFFIGFAFSFIDSKLKIKSILKKCLFISVTITLILACLIQFYPYQPLIPKGADLSNSLPNNSYVVDLTLVNTPYQVSMLSFANSYSREGLIISDLVSRSQAYGFTDPSFFTRIVYNSPLVNTELFAENWTLLLLHYGKAGPFRESVQYRTDDVIQNISHSEGSVVYDNGASLIMVPNR